jgi:hypothetical protein
MGSAPGTIPISNVVNISVSFASSGIPGYNVANLALFTGDAFLSNPNNDLYRVYTNLATVGTDFGTTTETYTQASNVFAQQPNILNGGGFLIIVPFGAGAISAITVGGGGSGYKVGDILNVIESGASGGQVSVSTVTAQGTISAAAIYNVGINYTIINGLTTSGAASGGTSATINVTAIATETLAQAVARANTYLYYNGIIATNYGSSNTWASLAATVQGLGNQLLFLPSNSLSDISGAFSSIQLATDYFTRCLYYGSNGTAVSATVTRSFAAAYASRLLSTNYNGSNTSITMNLKQLINVVPDTTLTATLLSQLSTAGVDSYGNYGGTYPGVVSVGANKFADEAMNLIWLVTSLQVAGFNALATVSTKIPYTETGMQALKAAYRQVLTQAVSNGYLAPGSWLSSYTFGNQTLFLSNILQYGFYIYSSPVNQQSLAQITARTAPLIQIAALEAGAIQESSVLINILA